MTLDRCRLPTRERRVVAELCELVVAPGPDAAVARQRQPVVLAGGDGADGREAM